MADATEKAAQSITRAVGEKGWLETRCLEPEVTALIADFIRPAVEALEQSCIETPSKWRCHRMCAAALRRLIGDRDA